MARPALLLAVLALGYALAWSPTPDASALDDAAPLGGQARSGSTRSAFAGSASVAGEDVRIWARLEPPPLGARGAGRWGHRPARVQQIAQGGVLREVDLPVTIDAGELPRWPAGTTFTARGSLEPGVPACFVPRERPSLVRLAGPGLRDRAGRINRDLARILRDRLDDPAASLAAAKLLGRREGLPRELHHAYRDAGILHILAISGLHLSILALFLGLLVRSVGMPLPWRHGVLIVAAFSYALLVDLRPPVLRAAIMVSILAAACYCRRRPDHWSALYVAWSVCLFLEPGWISDPGFQLSFIAVAAILFAARRDGERTALDAEAFLVRKLVPAPHPFVQYAKDALRITMAVSIVMEPLLVFHFSRYNLATFLGNLLVVPVATLGLILSWLVLVPGLGPALAPVLEIVVWLEVTGARLVARVPGLSTNVMPPSLAMLLAYYGGVLLVLRAFQRPDGPVVLYFLLCSLLWLVLPLPGGETVIHHHDALTTVQVHGRTVTVEAETREARQAARRIARLGVHTIDILVIHRGTPERWRDAFHGEDVRVLAVHALTRER